jgi:peptidoglycan hydrolase CwlO-like protein
MIQNEIDFLEQYYNFYLKSKNDNFASFIAAAQKALVNTGQITQDSLDKFQQMYYAQQEIAQKNEEIRKLEAKIASIKKEIGEQKKKYEGFLRGKAKSKTERKSEPDPCGHGGGVSSSHC